MEKNRYNVQIGTNNYLLTTNKSREETDKIVDYVDSMIKTASKSIQHRNPTMQATLACINIADELNTISSEYERLKKEAEVPIREYFPLKEEFEKYKEDSKDFELKISKMEAEIHSLKNESKLIGLDRDKFKLELDRQLKEAEKNKEEVVRLRNELIAQEKENLKIRKQLQEAVKS